MSRLFLVISFIIISFSIVVLFPGKKSEEKPLSITESEITASYDFIEQELQKNGIQIFLCKKDFNDCRGMRYSPFIASMICEILRELNPVQFSDFLKNETQKLSQFQGEHFFWDFNHIKNAKEDFYFPDLDTTSLTAYFLMQQNVEIYLEKIREQIEETQFQNGVLLTFLRDFQPPGESKFNHDPVVNANTLVILDKEIPSVCNFVNGNFEKSLYYEDDIVVFYMLSKAYKRGIKCIRPALKNLYEKLKKSGVIESKDSPLHLSMFISACFNSEIVEKKVMEKTMNTLFLKTEPLPFKENWFHSGLKQEYDYYFSPAFSAAVYAEALTNIKSYLSESE